ncbi:ROK family protein [Bifidobacterium callimiconis]|uniref:NagC family transcriptional regulator n=1 Tax=Bifidobacterium callimiconis TaxID=2306973 RepID=A0A430FCS0_9BIFI|nr:ROK family protein [Bifidobacterium callimiconis]MBT1176739.1 ROK family protein [Bifidobacterium callimiconis]RSX50639.1 NagC family transcriptional regulator [Bifidobacterium callimiconis]
MSRSRSINQDDLRNHNLSVVLTTLLQSDAPMSRAQLAKSTGLTKATMSLLSDILLTNEVVEELDPQQKAGNGRPSTPLAFRPGCWVGIGMQINTDGYGYTVTDIAGETVMGEWVDRPMTGVTPDEAFAALDELLLPAEATLKRRNYRIVGTGLALPGLIAGQGTGEQRLLMAPNLGWTNIDLHQYDAVRRLEALADNEANLAAIAQIPGYASCRPTAQVEDVARETEREHADEDARPGETLSPNDSFLYISTDVGVGGAFVRSGALVRGDHGFAGELGHVSVDMNGPQCRCGRRGCLEMYAGRRELVRAAGIADGDEAVQSRYVQELHDRWRDGDGKAASAIDQALNAMASVAATVINVLDVDTIVLGGFWSVFGEELAARLRERVVPQILAGGSIDLRVLSCASQEHPALHGAAAYGLRRFIERPMDFLDI